MRYKALRTFAHGRGLISAGDTVELEDSYAKQLSARRPPWVEAAGPQPSLHQAIAAAPEVKTSGPIGTRPIESRPAGRR